MESPPFPEETKEAQIQGYGSLKGEGWDKNKCGDVNKKIIKDLLSYATLNCDNL